VDLLPAPDLPGAAPLGRWPLKAGQQVLEHGHEGLVAKDPASPYVGGRTLKWLKVKQRNYRIEERGLDSRNKS
jgi:hypothetical protein